MTARSRLLVEGGVNSPPPHSRGSSPTIEDINSDFVVILTALLCALICVLGLVAVARCSWIRRITGGDSSSPPATASNIKGLKKKALKSLPKLTYSEDDVEAAKLHDCAICLADFAAGEEIRVLPQCGHGFHVACVDTWLASHASCPSCRRILEVARCHECGRLPPATACSAVGLRPEARESQAIVGFYP
ncbi:RING/U-box superfamily protein [Perilla frutescens var. hirtella]|uniref:RING/U-box superfamily protein n=1 Tax=Perilla frutescens var. hirtella TaxID=608512 RepID=A0AAD4JKH3_PERFH|nr:RING/U-box superfamily protein [Perilla frutescens var. hirtella]